MKETEFLDLFAFTRPEVTAEEFYAVCMKINERVENESWERFKRAATTGIEKGIQVMKDIYEI